MGWIHRPTRRPPFLARYGSAAFMAFCVGSVLWMILIESVFNGGLKESVRWLWLPWLALVVGYVVRYRRWLAECYRGKAWKAFGLAALIYPLLILMSWPYVMAANAAGDGGSIEYAGRIEKKWISGGKTTSHLFDILSANAARTTVQVNEHVYETAQVGQHVHCSYRQGLFGIPYRWRYGEAGPACEVRSK